MEDETVEKRGPGRPPKAKEEEGGIVQLSRGEFDILMGRLSKLENPGVQRQVKREKEHIAYMRVWEDRIVTKIGKVTENLKVAQGEPTRTVIEVELMGADSKKESVSIPYLDFLNYATKVTAKIIKMEVRERTETDPKLGGGGLGNRYATDSQGRLTDSVTGDTIAYEVTYREQFAQVEVMDVAFQGRIFDLGPDTINVLNA
jgi:hypothetical protein